MEQYVSAYLLKLRRSHPFFATLSLYMDYSFTEGVPKFETDGKKALISPQYFSRLSNDERIGTLLHLTLHCALLHPLRCGARIEAIWNIAADIVVNQMVVDSNFAVPPGTTYEPRYAGCSVEFIYTQLLSRAKKLSPHLSNSNSRACEYSEQKAPTQQGAAQPEFVEALQVIYPSVSDLNMPDSDTHPSAGVIQNGHEAFWKNALLQAQAVERMSHQTPGNIPAGLSRAIDEILHPQLDWRTLLWRFMSRTPCDYSGFDRRFIHQGLYLEQLEGESLVVHIAIDTSGSIGDEQLAQFRAEVESIARCYSIRGKLYFVDAEVYGPYPLTQSTRVVAAEGGGGTDFSVFFQKLEETMDPFEDALCIYLTDGYGTFPKRPPNIPMLWVATDDAIRHFPFGEVARLR